MIFRELRESILSEEDAATTIIRVSRSIFDSRVKELTAGSTEAQKVRATTTKVTKVHEGESGIRVSLFKLNVFRAENDERFSAFSC
jgi:hypothetical protein